MGNVAHIDVVVLNMFVVVLNESLICDVIEIHV